MSAEKVYDELAEAHGGDEHWAFGTGFTDAGVQIDAPVPDGAGPAELAEYCLMLGDDALIYAQRLSEWVANAPELEEEVALANTALDLLGQARLLLSRAGHLLGRTEDELAYWRSDAEFRHVNLAELGDGDDFGVAVARLLIFASWRLAVLHRLRDSRDPVLAAVAAKGVKELAYHRDYAARWTLRLGDGTPESHDRMRAALDYAWPYLAELFRVSEPERRLAAQGVAVDPAEVEAEVREVLGRVITRATLEVPERTPIGTIGGRGGRQGVHTEHLGRVLAEMQSLARQHPQATW
ncbi:phenylacetate-CoA oxygenase subunit PaaC [Pseudonocardia eucalypti]|uniref:Phenylacetate-CoA oxygenase subunit PaaC n=1 Tax=Pseudonocardia eucalypti TaxID=648755 RepID=A0ABP9R3W9_9PSEU|nr:ring-1,2-phenylacetyl-CoA epoxidase subunit PaaC [Pseudonocardia eucalypti]